MNVYKVIDYDGEYNRVYASEEVAYKVKQWLLENKVCSFIKNVTIEEEELVETIDDFTKRYNQRYVIETNADCSIANKYRKWQLIKYKEVMFVRHWDGTGYSVSSISYEDVWNKLVIEWDRIKEIFSKKNISNVVRSFPDIKRIIEYKGN